MLGHLVLLSSTGVGEGSDPVSLLLMLAQFQGLRNLVWPDPRTWGGGTAVIWQRMEEEFYGSILLGILGHGKEVATA